MNPAEIADDHRASVRAGSRAAWMMAVRPWSLPVAIGPVVVGAALGFARTGAIDLRAAPVILGAALLMQVVTNLQNDIGFTERGGERDGRRTGPPRATASGLLSARQVRAGIVLAAVVATGFGLALTLLRGWPVLAVGSASLVAAMAYMGGPRPIAYTPFGELTVLVFFGLVAVLGTDWALTGAIGAASVPAAAAMGSLAAAALAMNNHRDMAHDRFIGRRTFAVSFGERASRRFVAALLFAPFALLPLIAPAAGIGAALPALLLPATWRLHRDFAGSTGGAAINPVLFRTFRMSLAFAALLAAGVLATISLP